MSRGGTVFSTGLREAQRILDSSGGEEGTTPHIIFMSDGHNAGGDDPVGILSSIYSRWRSHGLKLNVLGFEGGDPGYLTRMAETAGSDGTFDYASNGTQLVQIFSRIADDGKTQQKMFTMVADTIGREVSDQIELDFL